MKKGVDYTGITVVYFCFDSNGNLLLAKRSVNCRDEHGKWDCGSGAIEFGDSPENTLRKEIKEEYCTDIIEYEFLGYRDVHRELDDGTKTHWVALDFKVLVDRDMVKIGEPYKFDDIGWFTKDSLPSNLHSQLPNALEKYKNKF